MHQILLVLINDQFNSTTATLMPFNLFSHGLEFMKIMQIMLV